MHYVTFGHNTHNKILKGLVFTTEVIFAFSFNNINTKMICKDKQTEEK